MITIPAYSYVLTGNIIFTGLTLLVEYGIYSVTFWAGPVTDRLKDKRYAISASECGIAIASLFLAWLMYQHSVDKYFFLLIVGIIAVFWDVIWTADHSILPLIVKDEELANANGITNAMGNGHVAAGLAVGGFLFAFFGAYGSMVLYAASMFIAATLALFIPLVVPENERKLGTSFIGGWKYIFSVNRDLLKFYVIIAFFSLFANIPVLVMAGVYATTLPVWYSISFSTFYIGAMISSFVIGKYFPYRKIGVLLVFTFLLSGLLMIVTSAFYASLILDIAPWFALGFFFSLHTTLGNVYLQKVTVKEMLGRTASNLYTFRGITTSVGSILFPLWMALHGIVLAAIVSGLIMTLGAILIYISSEWVRRLGVNQS